MKRVLLLAVLASLGMSQSARAENAPWMFNRSYYSHEPVQNVRIGRAPTGGPYYTRPRGAYVNSGWRWNRSTINVGGQVYDNVNMIESWVQSGGQF